MKYNKKDLTLGVERHIDNLGRVVLPKEMRDKLQFKENQKVSIKLFKNYIQVEKVSETCYFCESNENLENYKGLNLCTKCLKEIIYKFNK